MDIQEKDDFGASVIEKVDEESRKEDGNFLQRNTAESDLRVKIKIIDIIPQLIASCVIHAIVIQAGVNMAYSTVLLNGLESNNTGLTITENEGSWIASLVTITLPIGSLIAGPLMDKFGRKAISLLACIPMMISWVLLIFAQSVNTIYAARIIAGIAAGLSTVELIYVSEITHPQVRPMFLSFNSLFVSLGILMTCCLTVLMDWRRMAIIFLVLKCCIFFALFCIPESPYWLIHFKNGMLDEKRICKMKHALRRLNKRHAIYEQEYSRIMETCNNCIPNDETSKTIAASIKNYYHKFSSPAAYKPIVILILLFLLQQLSGSYLIIFYAISVFREMGGSFGKVFDENGAFVMLGVVRFSMSMITVFSSLKYGRRPICILSGIGMTISMLLSGMYIHFTVSYDESGNAEETMVNYKWLLLVFVLFYVCASTFGFVNIPWTLIGELLPVSVRGIGGGIMVSFVYIVMFCVIKSYPYISKMLRIESIFFLFSITSMISTAYVYFFLPETLGKSFSDIEKYFSPKERETRDNTSKSP